jgi:integrase/recombinase XerC
MAFATTSSSRWRSAPACASLRIAALDVGDVLHEDRLRRRIALRTFKRSSTKSATQEVFIPDSLSYKLGKLVSWKRGEGEGLDPAAPLFMSRRGRRISTRTLRYLFAVWQQRAGLDRPFNFHALRHTALTNLYRPRGTSGSYSGRHASRTRAS